MTGGSSKITRTTVWWDFNTCPIPAGFNPLLVRLSIESAVRKLFGASRLVTIIAVGNLDHVSPELLQVLRFTGIVFNHTLFRGKDLFDLLGLWVMRNPPPGEYMLISGDDEWAAPGYNARGYTVFFVFPRSNREVPDYAACHKVEWDWETLLEENVDQSPWFCKLCRTPRQSYKDFNDFLKHLKSDEHEKLLLDVNNTPSTPVCDEDIHNKSEEHKENSKRLDKTSPHSPAEGSSMITRVWWDLDTCPVPDGNDPYLVRVSIESALEKYLGAPRLVTIVAYGNLDGVSRSRLLALFSTGILLVHSSLEPHRFNPPPSELMLISGGGWSFHDTPVFRAIPRNLGELFGSAQVVWEWETLLEENKVEYECLYPWWGKLCRIARLSAHDFIKHLKSEKHKEELIDSVTLEESLLCDLCDYFACDDHNMDIHYDSEQHKEKERAAAGEVGNE